MQAELNWYQGDLAHLLSHLDEEVNVGPFAEHCQILTTKSLTDYGSDYVSEILRIGLNGFNPDQLASYKKFQDTFRAEIIFEGSHDLRPLLGVPIIVVRGGVEGARAVCHNESGWWLILSTRLIEFYALWANLELRVLQMWSDPRNHQKVEHLLRIMGRLASDFFSSKPLNEQTARFIADDHNFVPPGTGAVTRMYLRFVLLHEYGHIWHDDHRGAERYSDLIRVALAGVLADERGEARPIESSRASVSEQEFRADRWAWQILGRKITPQVRATSNVRHYTAIQAGSALIPMAVAERLADISADSEYPTAAERIEAFFAQVSPDSQELRLCKIKRSLLNEICQASSMPLS